jgi:TMEM175 potassium channel family protein
MIEHPDERKPGPADADVGFRQIGTSTLRRELLPSPLILRGGMAEDEETPKTAATVGKGRIEAFSDGVFAIAITLLVLDLAVRPPGSPLHQFLRGWSSYLGYLVSFLTIGGAWISHNALTDDLDCVDSIFLRLNLLFLLAVAFLPFPTRLIAEALDEGTDAKRVAVTVYGLTLLLIRLLFAMMASYARHQHLRRPGVDDPDLQEANKKFRFAVVGYGVTIILGLFFPGVSIAFYFGIAVFLVVPFRTVAREVFGRRA